MQQKKAPLLLFSALKLHICLKLFKTGFTRSESGGTTNSILSFVFLTTSYISLTLHLLVYSAYVSSLQRNIWRARDLSSRHLHARFCNPLLALEIYARSHGNCFGGDLVRLD